MKKRLGNLQNHDKQGLITMTRFKETMSKSIFPISAIAAFALLSLISIHLSVYADGNQEYGATEIYKVNYVKLGTTITFHNTDHTAHTITGTDAQGNIVTSGVIQPDQTTELIFTKIGVFDFYDTLNPHNEGTIEIYNSLSDMQTFSSSTNGYAYKSSPSFVLLQTQTPVVNQPPPIVEPTSPPPVNNQTSTNSTSTNSTTTSTPLDNQTSTSNSTSTNTVTITQADLQTLNDKIDALQAKIDSMSITQDSILSGLQKLLRIFNLA